MSRVVAARRGVLTWGVVAACVVLAAACNANGQVDPALLTSDATIVARNIAFEPASITVRAAQPISLTLDNKDDGIPHGLAVTNGGMPVAASQIITGPGTIVLEVPPLVAGSYAFMCPVHPNMTGTLLAEP